jgi:hypothetical protein
VVINSFVFSFLGEQVTLHAFGRQTLTPFFWPFYSSPSGRVAAKIQGKRKEERPEGTHKQKIKCKKYYQIKKYLQKLL